jgi:hypothetical protein
MRDASSSEIHGVDGGSVCWGLAVVYGNDTICLGVSY